MPPVPQLPLETGATSPAPSSARSFPSTDHYRRFSRVDAVTPTERGLLATLHGETLEVVAVRPDVVRIRVSRGGRFDDAPSPAVCVDPLGQPVEVTTEVDDDVARVRTRELTVTVGLAELTIDVHRADGTPVVRTARDDAGDAWAYGTLNDAFVVRRRLAPEDGIYGLGEKTGRFDRRGRDFTLWNTDVLNPTASGEFTAGRDAADPRADRMSTEFDPYYVSIPFFHHLDAATGAVGGSFVDNAYRGAYDFTAQDEYAFHFAGGQYCEYVVAGPTMDRVIEAYTWLTGRAALPPLWALGHHQCRWHAYRQEDLETLAARMRAERIPCDTLWLDIDYMDGYRVFTWDEEKFPDPAGMIERLGDAGFRLITIIDPGVKAEPGYAVFDDGEARDVFCRTEGGDTYIGQVWPGDTAFPDFATPEARAWWGDLNAAHVASGLAGIWNDMNEPATGVIPPERMLFDGGRASHERFHNSYALLMAMGTVEGLRRDRPDLRTFVLTRAGSAGIQRYAANWMGDNAARWDHLWLSMPMAAGFGISGQPFVGADVGGFAGDTSAELFLRWMQYGALTPFFRNHTVTGAVDQYPWSFGADVLDGVRSAVELRYRLLPYLYAAFVRASETGEPVQRPLVLDFPDDPRVRDLDAQYLLGRDLLVVPVVQEGAREVDVVFPPGTWHAWHTGEVETGPATRTVAAPLGYVPLYVRGGAVVPMLPEAPATTTGLRPSLLELHVFVPDGDSEWTSLLQEDDGVTTAALDGARVRTTFTLTRAGDEVRLDARVDGDGYPEFARTAFRLVIHGATPREVELDGVALSPADDGTVTFDDDGRDAVVVLRL